MSNEKKNPGDEVMIIPVKAHYQVQPDGSIKLVDAVYAEITAGQFAKFLIERFPYA